MKDVKSQIEELLEGLKQEHDELQVRLHLAKEEFKDEWEEVETKLAVLEAKAAEVGKAAVDASGDVFAAASLLGEELTKAFDKIRKKL
jgi:hypothetical protein